MSQPCATTGRQS